MIKDVDAVGIKKSWTSMSRPQTIDDDESFSRNRPGYRSTTPSPFIIKNEVD